MHLALLGGPRDRDELRAPAVAVTAGELAWIAALPCALLTILAVVLLGPPLGHRFLAPHGEMLWPPEAPYLQGRPEPVKHARFGLALLGAALLTGVVLAGARRDLRLSQRVTDALVGTSQLLTCSVLVVAIVAQRHVTYPESAPVAWRIFSTPTLVTACLVAAAVAGALRASRVLQSVTRRAGARVADVACLAAAAAVTGIWLLPAVETEHTTLSGPFPDLPAWAMGDTYAILNGRTPLVDFHAIYGQLWAYIAALPMAVFGDTIDVFTIAMVSISGVALLAVYAVLRRIVGNPLLALLLYLPFLATSLFEVPSRGVLGPASNAQIYSVWPMRYAGPLIVAWLTVRHLDRARPRAVWPLALVGGLVVVNNLEFGLAALVATLVALACVPERWSWRGLVRLAQGAAVGLLGSVLLISLLTLVRAGSLPHFGFMREFPHIFGTLGLVSLPMATLGFHLALFVTFVAALVTAAVRVAQKAEDTVLTGMLAWSGVFGLIGASYFTGRSDVLKLAALFPAWAFALALLTVAVMRDLTARRWRVPTPAELAVLVGWGLAVCSVAQVRAPWTEVARLRAGAAPAVYESPVARRFVDRRTRAGDHVAILAPMSHRVAYELGVVNVSPYGTMEAMATRAQLRTLFDAMRDTHARKLFLANQLVVPAHVRALQQAGFVRVAQDAAMSYWTWQAS